MPSTIVAPCRVERRMRKGGAMRNERAICQRILPVDESIAEEKTRGREGLAIEDQNKRML
jgi:hypothetical protein